MCSVAALGHLLEAGLRVLSSCASRPAGSPAQRELLGHEVLMLLLEDVTLLLLPWSPSTTSISDHASIWQVTAAHLECLPHP